ncbi:hypothetical protein CYMTET_25190 [Cymbomonas tetramitiformis]|uniref:Uncharacterized protein n=1 Tax=Cymbomonas tetramitiformis TaxID=36881 RepID=A0AAE0KZF6_9CHLO|nr:hypothetical protein CYMTET_25190 [Cymbomonas tetramitiformis]
MPELMHGYGGSSASPDDVCVEDRGALTNSALIKAAVPELTSHERGISKPSSRDGSSFTEYTNPLSCVFAAQHRHSEDGGIGIELVPTRLEAEEPDRSSGFSANKLSTQQEYPVIVSLPNDRRAAAAAPMMGNPASALLPIAKMSLAEKVAARENAARTTATLELPERGTAQRGTAVEDPSPPAALGGGMLTSPPSDGVLRCDGKVSASHEDAAQDTAAANTHNCAEQNTAPCVGPAEVKPKMSESVVAALLKPLFPAINTHGEDEECPTVKLDDSRLPTGKMEMPTEDFGAEIQQHMAGDVIYLPYVSLSNVDPGEAKHAAHVMAAGDDLLEECKPDERDEVIMTHREERDVVRLAEDLVPIKLLDERSVGSWVLLKDGSENGREDGGAEWRVEKERAAAEAIPELSESDNKAALEEGRERVTLPENHSPSMLHLAKKPPQAAIIASTQQTAPQEVILKPELTSRGGEAARYDADAAMAAALLSEEGTASSEPISTTKMSLAEKVAARQAAHHTPPPSAPELTSRDGEVAHHDDDAAMAAALPREEGTASSDPISTTKMGLAEKVAARQAAHHTPPPSAPELTSRGGEAAHHDDDAAMAAALRSEEDTASSEPASPAKMSLAEKVAARQAAHHTPSASELTSRGGKVARYDDDAAMATALQSEEGTASSELISTTKMSLAEKVAARRSVHHTPAPSAPELTSRGGEAARHDADAAMAAALPREEGTASSELISTAKMSLAEKVAARQAAHHTPPPSAPKLTSRGGEAAHHDDDAVMAAALPSEEGIASSEPISTTN